MIRGLNRADARPNQTIPVTLSTRVADGLRRRSFWCALFWNWWRLKHSPADPAKAVLVYQMGKVGSSTVVAALDRLKPEVAVYHVHNLTNQGRAAFGRYAKRSFRKRRGTQAQRESILERLVLEKHLIRRLRRTRPGEKWRVVTLVREPVARNLSAFFETLPLRNDYNFEKAVQKKRIDELVPEICELFLSRYANHDRPLTLFDERFREVMRVDVFGKPFPQSQGYEIYDSDRAKVLLLRLEDIDRCAVEAFHRFMGISEFRPVHANVGEEKRHAAVYKRLLNSIRLPDAYLSKMYDSKYTTHFYSAREIAAFREKWKRRTV